MEPKDVASYDQAMMFLAENLPPIWKRFYDNCLASGFNAHDAMRLVQTYILSQCPYGVNGERGK